MCLCVGLLTVLILLLGQRAARVEAGQEVAAGGRHLLQRLALALQLQHDGWARGVRYRRQNKMPGNGNAPHLAWPTPPLDAGAGVM